MKTAFDSFMYAIGQTDMVKAENGCTPSPGLSADHGWTWNWMSGVATWSPVRMKPVARLAAIAIGHMNETKPIRPVNRPVYGHAMLFRPQIDLNLTSQHHVPPGI